MHNYLEAYLAPCHLSKITLFAIVNLRETLNIFAKKLHLGFLIGL